jgi:teichoic acid transport system ATP-binding protein
MPAETIISVQGVSKKFCRSLKRTMLYGARDVACEVFGLSQISDGLRPDEFWALDNVSFDVKRGECLGLIGPNGAGKSTLLKLLNGITLPDKGEIKVAGRVGALLELGAGFHPMLTGRENVHLNGAILGLSKDEVAKKFDAIVDFAGLQEFIDSPVKHYSSGMYVRLGFAIAVHAEPDIFLIDEALAVGDGLFQSKCYAKLREIRENGTTIVFVTHNLDLITTHCSRAVLLDKGIVIGHGMPTDLVNQYNRLMAQKGRLITVPRYNVVVGLNASTPSKELEWSGLFNINPHEDRYGLRRAEILEAGIFSVDNVPAQLLERGREFLIKIKVRHNEPMPAAIVAYSIKDPTGLVLCGTNTMYQKIDVEPVQSGTIVLVVFRQVARLNPGVYLLSIGCGTWETGEYEIYDRRFDYMSFQIVGTNQRVGIFDPDSEIEWKQLN